MYYSLLHDKFGITFFYLENSNPFSLFHPPRQNLVFLLGRIVVKRFLPEEQDNTIQPSHKHPC